MRRGAGDEASRAPAYPGAMRPVAVYSALRVGLFLAVLLVLRVLGVGGVLSLVLAVVLALLLSFIVLRRQRDAVTRALMARQAAKDPSRRRTWRDRLAEDAAVEDAVVEGTVVEGSREGRAVTDPAARRPQDGSTR